jgi:hypothetical protein
MGFYFSRWDDIELASNMQPIGGPYGKHVFVRVGFVWLVLVTAMVPALFGIRLRFRSVRRARLVRAGRCRDCGYDLRSSPERCPECGTPAAWQR